MASFRPVTPFQPHGSIDGNVQACCLFGLNLIWVKQTPNCKHYSPVITQSDTKCSKISGENSLFNSVSFELGPKGTIGLFLYSTALGLDWLAATLPEHGYM